MTSEPVRSCFFLLRLFAARVKRSSSYIIVLPLLSALMHRLINWKPRLFATRWTLFGTRRSPTAESPRRTCTARRSGKCLSRRLFFLFLSPFTSCLSALSCPPEGWLSLSKDFLSSIAESFTLSLQAFTLFVSLCSLSPSISADPLILWSSDPPPSPHLLSSPVLTSLPSTRIREDLPSLLLSHPSLFVFPSPRLSLPAQETVTDWGQTTLRGAF